VSDPLDVSGGSGPSGPLDVSGGSGPSDPLRLFGQFVGSWDVESSLAGAGEWHFAWILGGTAIQDVISPVGAPPEQQGTTVRAYDPGAGLWHVFYTCPQDGEFVLLTGRAEGERIVQLGHDLAGPSRRLRWTFSDIEPASFRWTGEVSTDGGATWRLTHEMRAKRRT
jgi:hypothetical protein